MINHSENDDENEKKSHRHGINSLRSRHIVNIRSVLVI